MRDNIVLIIVGMAVVTYLTRFSFLFLFRTITLPDSVLRGFRFLPIGILAAMIAPGLILADGQFFFHWQNSYLLAGIAAVIAAARWKNMFASLGTGLAVILLSQILFV
ncbi:MAG: AzlD domain-containing protein [Bacillota bacterium]|nr:AzlD domain-containing protein [Bacillota bacterium]